MSSELLGLTSKVNKPALWAMWATYEPATLFIAGWSALQKLDNASTCISKHLNAWVRRSIAFYRQEPCNIKYQMQTLKDFLNHCILYYSGSLCCTDLGFSNYGNGHNGWGFYPSLWSPSLFKTAYGNKSYCKPDTIEDLFFLRKTQPATLREHNNAKDLRKLLHM